MLLDTDTESNGHLPKGILASIGPALAGSDQPTFGLEDLSDKYRQIIRQNVLPLFTFPISVMVTVGLTAFTRT